MIRKRLAVVCAAMFALTACAACGGAHTHTFETEWTTSETEHWRKATCEHKEETSERGGHDFGDGGVCKVCGYRKQETNAPPDDGTFDLAAFDKLPIVPLSSVYAVEEGASCKLKMEAPYTDEYEVSFSAKAVERVQFFNAEGKQLFDSTETITLNLAKGEIVYANVFPAEGKTTARFTVNAKENRSPLPFAIAEAPDPAGFDVYGDPDVDPLEAAALDYSKREDTLYVYSNAPETLRPEVVNKCLTRQDVSNRSVFFTYEHQSSHLTEQGMESNGVYYGYRVTNTGTDDLFLTVKNIGLQMDGLGCWLGEREWLDFYNLPFRVEGLDTLNESQQKHFESFFNFENNLIVHDFQPTTYRIPAGKFMYVIGGTTKDAFGGFDVGKTADRLSANSDCTNGAVLFDVKGQAEGAFYVYNDIAAVNEGGSGYDTHLGIYDMANPRGSVGTDEGYVVDNRATWVFNDKTRPQTLPVTFVNYYADDPPKTGEPCSPIPEGETPHRQNRTDWVTHFDAQSAPEHCAVGTDITVFHTVRSENGHAAEDIHYGLYNYSTQGIILEMGNWMKDYQDLFTFVNQGDKPRTVRVNIMPNGGIAAFFRDMQGKLIEGTERYGIYHNAQIIDGVLCDPIDLAVHQEFVIPAHSVFQVVAEYNLMANSNGFMRHFVELL